MTTDYQAEQEPIEAELEAAKAGNPLLLRTPPPAPAVRQKEPLPWTTSSELTATVASTAAPPKPSSTKGSGTRSFRKLGRRGGTVPPPVIEEPTEPAPPPPSREELAQAAQSQQYEIERLIEAGRAANPRLLIHAPDRLTSDSPMVRMPAQAGSLVVTDATGKVAWPAQPEAAPIEASGEQVYLVVPPDAQYATSEGRLLLEGWTPPVENIRRVILAREALRLALRAVSPRRRNGSRLIDRAARSGDVEATVEAIVGVAVDEWWNGAGLNTADSEMSGISQALELEFERLLWSRQRAVLSSLVGRDSPAAAQLRARVERMLGTPAPRTSIGFGEYILRA
jgi:hypothetical protein